MKDRKWKTSSIVPYGSNVLVKVYDCGDKQLKASIYVNEIPVEMYFENIKCVKCPLENLIDLIESFKTEENMQCRTEEDDDVKANKINT